MCVRFEIHPDRWQLGFVPAVHEAFSFLEDRGFRIVEESPVRVVYRSPAVEVRVWHGRGSYELGLSLGLREAGQDPAEWFPIPTIAEAAGAPHDPRLARLQCSTAAAVPSCVERLAGLLWDYEGGALQAEEAAFAGAANTA